MGRTSLLKVTSWPDAATENTSRQHSAVPIERMIALLDRLSIRNSGRQYTRLPRRAGMARPEGLEPSTPGLEVDRKEATGGSARPLPLILLRFGQAPDHPRRNRDAPVRLLFVSRRPLCFRSIG